MEQQNYMVCVSCMTYNHAPYITDALNGFCMQETTFPFVCTITDDASTDGEQEVIKKYLQEHFDLEDKTIVRNEETDDYILTFARHKNNKNCFFVVLYLKYNHYSIRKAKRPYTAEWRENSKYIAFCEGDDYWILANKLQKQVDFLENNKEYSMCFHSAKIENYLSNRDNSILCESIENREYKSDELFSKWIVPTASILSRVECFEIQTLGNERIVFGDKIHLLKCAKIGLIYGMSDTMSVYRISSQGVSHNKKLRKEILKKWPDYLDFIEDNFGSLLSHKLINQQRGITYLRLALHVHKTFSKSWFVDIIKMLKYNPLAFVSIVRTFVDETISL